MEIKTEKNPLITIAMVSYNRPAFLKETIDSLFKNPGIRDFEFVLWDNNCNEETLKIERELAIKYPIKFIRNSKNIGQIALAYILEEAKGEYFVMLEDDELWFQDGWLSEMLRGFENKMPLNEEGKKLKWKEEWGVISSNVLIDPVNNAGMWKEKLKNILKTDINGINYWLNVIAGGGILMFSTKVLKELDAFPRTAKYPNDAMDTVHKLILEHKYPMAYLPDIYIYHACSPFWNQLYKETWNEKQRGQITIEEAFRQYKERGEFDWDNEWILDLFLQGNFNRYATELCALHRK